MAPGAGRRDADERGGVRGDSLWRVNTENLRTVTALSTAEMRRPTARRSSRNDNRYLASDVKLWLGDLF